MLTGSISMRVGFGKEMEDTVATDRINRRRERSDNHNEVRNFRAKIKRDMDTFQKQFETLVDHGKELLMIMKGHVDKNKDITPAHYAALIIGSRSYIKVWVTCIIKDIIPTLSKVERDIFTMKTLIALKDYLDEKEIKKLVNVMLKDIDPKMAIILQYYFPKYITAKEDTIISEFLNNKQEEAVDVIENIVNAFEKRTAVFFKHLHELLKNKH